MVGPLFAAALLSSSPYEVDPAVDVTTTVAAFAFVGLSEAVVKPTLRADNPCRHTLENGLCDPKDLLALDRTVIDNDSKTWRLTSDIGAVASYVLPLVLEGIDVGLSDSETPAQDYLIDALVMTESLAVATTITQAFKFAIRRPRPTYYREGAFVGSVEHQLSFPSGHTSSAAAASFAYASTYARRHPDSPWRYVAYGAATGLTVLTGYARVGAGWHFYSDVLAGAIVGAASGIVVPAMHAKNGVVVVPSVSPRGLAAAVQVAF